jgi:hypothetical protein
MEERTTIEKVDEFRRKQGYPDLVIKRVPKKELEWFRKISYEEYEGDYGMLLKRLIEISFEYYEMKATMLNLIDLLSTKEKQLLSKEPRETEKKVIKMGSGREIEIGGEK